MKEKHINIRISKELYNAFIKKALDKSNKEKRLVKLSEVVREALETL